MRVRIHESGQKGAAVKVHDTLVGIGGAELGKRPDRGYAIITDEECAIAHRGA